MIESLEGLFIPLYTLSVTSIGILIIVASFELRKIMVRDRFALSQINDIIFKKGVCSFIKLHEIKKVLKK